MGSEAERRGDHEGSWRSSPFDVLQAPISFMSQKGEE